MKNISRRKFIYGSSLLGVSMVLFKDAKAGKMFLRSRGFDIVIRGGHVIDGSGKKEFLADVGIKDGQIVKIGNLNSVDSQIFIDAKGLKIVPGFIDIHSHTDTDLILNPKAESKIRQGVTTEVCGQDGSSWAPTGGLNLERELESFKEEYGEELPWRTMKEFLDNFSQRKFCVNLSSMFGLGTIRKIIVGMDNRPATQEEIKLMQIEVEKAIKEGAIGVSTGLEYTPGSFASTEELIELCKAVPEYARLYATHMRNEDDSVLQSIDEAMTIAKNSNSRLQISHLKVQGKSNWNKADEALSKIDSAIKDGLEVTADRYPYVAFHTNLANLFPLWSREGGTKKFIERLNDKFLLVKMRKHSEEKVSDFDGDWNGVLIAGVGKDQYKNYQGKTVKQIGDEKGKDYFNTAVEIILETENDASMVGFGMDEPSTEKILAHPKVMIASDAGSHAPYPPMNKSIAHPRAYGTFPRAISKYVRERNICSLEEMIKKMTSMPADKLGFKERGRLEEGMAADVVIFNYETIQDNATFTDPHQYPDGIPYVIVNGEIVIDNGEHTGAMPGKVIKN